MRTTLAALTMTLVFAACASADVIHFTDYESDGDSQGVGFGIQPASMDFTSGGGDFIGEAGLGISSDNAASGSFAYVVDAGNTVDNGNGWGGNWSGIDSNSGNGSGGFLPQADVIAAGNGCYIEYTEGATFTLSVDVATDANNPATGTVIAAPRLEFLVDGVEAFRNDAGAPLDASTLTTEFQTMTWSYTLNVSDELFGITSVQAVIGADGLGFESSSGLIYFDNVLFEVDAAHVVVVGDGHGILGDANGDGSFDFGDIEAFFLAITDLFTYTAQYPSVAISSLDMNADGNTDFGDIEAFFAAVTGG